MRSLKLCWVSMGIVLVSLSVGVLVLGSPLSAQEEEYVYNDNNRRDPFWKLIGARGTIINFDKDLRLTDLMLEGIMAEPGGQSAAIINGTIVAVGDKVGLFNVKEIQPSVVILEKGQEIVTLQLKKEE